MTRATEARFWQAIGVVVGVGGGLLMAYTFGEFGFASVQYRALECGMAASFLMLAGLGAFLAGRSLHVRETKLTRLERVLWIVLAIVCLFGGGMTVVGAKLILRQAMILDRMATGVAGASAMLFGVMALVGERVMSHMHDALVGGTTEEKAKAAGA